MLTNDNDYVKKIYLKKMTLKVKDINSKNGNFINTQLVIPDVFHGRCREVSIDYLIEDDYIYLRSVKPLYKYEFEELFNFGNRDFKVGKIILLPLTSVSFI